MVEIISTENRDAQLGSATSNDAVTNNENLLSVKDLVTYFFTEEGIVRAVEGVSFDIKLDEVVGLVGETGCGKSVTALSIIQLVRQPGKIMGGHVYFKGQDLLEKTETMMRQIRGKNITMIFQDPMNSLNPVFTIERQLNEVFLLHQKNELLATKTSDLDTWSRRTEKDFEEINRQLAEMKQSLGKVKQKARGLKGEIHTLEKTTVVKVTKTGVNLPSKAGVYNVKSSSKVKFKNLNQEIEEMSDLEKEQLSQNLKEKKEELKNIEGEIAHVQMEIFRLRNEKKNPKRRKLDYYATLKSINALKEVKIHTPEKIIKSYPHELSGGMRQRVMIAMALACNPELLIADEPTTALDVTIQAQILELMRQLKQKFKTSILIITHDLGTIAELCDRVAVMYSGRIVEYGNVYTLFKDPKHPYTQGLMKSIPDISVKVNKLPTIPGTVPNLIYPPSGCRFHPRCPNRMIICDKVKPPLYEIDDNYFAACFLFAKTGKVDGIIQEDKFPDELFNAWEIHENNL